MTSITREARATLAVIEGLVAERNELQQQLAMYQAHPYMAPCGEADGVADHLDAVEEMIGSEFAAVKQSARDAHEAFLAFSDCYPGRNAAYDGGVLEQYQGLLDDATRAWALLDAARRIS